jgi:hypothetical protein
MDVGVATIIAAAVTSVGGLLGAAIKAFKDMHRQNREDHGNVMKEILEVKDGVNQVSERLNDHIGWHLKK